MVPCAEGEVLEGFWVVGGGVSQSWGVYQGFSLSRRLRFVRKATGEQRRFCLDLQWQLEAGGRRSAVMRLLIISEAARCRVEASWAVTRTRRIIAEL